MNKLNRFSLTLFISVLLISIPAAAFSSAGKAIYVIGKVMSITDAGEEQRIRRTDDVNQGDTIITNNRSQIQIRMSDGTLLAVRPNSRFRIDDYVHKDDVETDKSHYNLIKGTFRSITGSIGSKNKQSYMVHTPVGTIGIRGTDFSARLCDGDCGDANDGLYVGVMQGEIVLNNDSGEINVEPGDFGYMQDQNIEPSQLESSPGDLLFAHTDTETHTEIASTVDSTTTSSLSSEQASEQTSDSNTISDTEVVSASTSTNDENLVEVTVISDLIIDPIDTSIVLPSTGIATYNVFSSTAPTSGTTTGVLVENKTSLTVDFIDPSATAIITANFNNNDWTGVSTQTMAIATDGTFSGDLSVSIADPFNPGSGTGSLTGSLSGIAESTIAAPTDANLSYAMNDGSTNLTGDITLAVSNTGPSN